MWNSVLLKSANNYLNANIYSYLEATGGQSYNQYLNAVYFLTPVLIRRLWQFKAVVFLHWCLICNVLFYNICPRFRFKRNISFRPIRSSHALSNLRSLVQARFRVQASHPQPSAQVEGSRRERPTGGDVIKCFPSFLTLRSNKTRVYSLVEYF